MVKNIFLGFIMMMISFNSLAGLIIPDLSEWELVRRVTAEHNGWHPTNDNLAGTDVYGVYSNSLTSNETFSIDFEDAVTGWDQILLATGNNEYWMMFNRSQLDITGGNVQMTVLASSISNTPYTVKFFNRSNNSEDPWLSYNDHLTTKSTTDNAIHSMLYGETHTGWNFWRTNNEGANVFIRNSTATSVPSPSSLAIFAFGLLALATYRRKIQK